jgi:hypothetical protein
MGEDGNGEFAVRVEATVADQFDIALILGGEPDCRISNSPYSLRKLVVMQGLHAPFGRPDHRKRKREAEVSEIRKKRCIIE